jgi:hypothetical protein
MSDSEKKKNLITWLKGLGVAGFLFFLIKGLIWVGVFAGVIKGCG